MQLKDKVVVVTGASKGTGAGIAKQMAAAGAKVRMYKARCHCLTPMSKAASSRLSPSLSHANSI